LEERGLEADPTTIWRWAQRYGPELEQLLRRHLKPTDKSWRVDETCVRVKGRWCYLYRAIDSAGATVDVFIPAIFMQLGIWPKPQRPATPEYLMWMETFAVRFIALPIVIAFFLLVIAAGRLLRRKKIF
jgi:hypothetical protein